jgi:hypothetical protein
MTYREGTSSACLSSRGKGLILSDTDYFKTEVSTDHEKIPARNSTYAHAQGFAMRVELLLAILKASVPQHLNKQDSGLSCVCVHLTSLIYLEYYQHAHSAH